MGILLGILSLAFSCSRPDADLRGSGRIVEDISRVSIGGFCEDEDGTMWMSSQTQGLLRYDGRYYIQYLPSDDTLSISSKFINCLEKDGAGRLWIGTQKGVDRYDPELDGFVHYDTDEGNRYILELVTDPTGHIFALTKRSLLALDEKNHSFHSVIDFPQTESIGTRAVIGQEEISIFFDSSIERYDRDFHHLGSQSVETPPQARPFFYTDSRGNRWIGLSSGGYRIIRSNQFAHTVHGNLLSAIEEHHIGCFLQDGSFIYVILDNRSLLVYDTGRQQCEAPVDLDALFRESASGPYSLSAFGKDGLLLIGNGDKAFLVRHSGNGVLSLQGLYINDNPAGRMTFIADGIGGVWAAGVGATVYYAKAMPLRGETVPMEAIPFREEAFVNASNAIRLRNGDVLIAYSDIGILHVRPSDGSRKLISLPVPDAQYFIRGMFEDQEDAVWVFTSDEGLFRYLPLTGSMERIDAFRGADVTDVADDANGFLYCISGNTLYVKKSGEESFSRLWSGVQDNDGEKALLLLPDGQLELHTQQGFRSVNILSGKAREALDVSLNVFFTENDAVVARLDPHLLRARPQSIVLPSRYQNLNIQFPVIEPYGQNLYNYAFQTGWNEGWQSVQGSPSLPLYNLSWGRNTIRLKAVDASSLSESLPVELSVTIRRPGYQYAMMIAGLLAFLLVLGLLRAHEKKRRAAEVAEDERRVQEQINRNNIDFFSNVSHEFRTPISLIEGAVSSLSEDKDLSLRQEELTGIIRRNSGRMLRLVDQMLDFNRLDHDMLALQVSLKDVSSIVLEISRSFEMGAHLKRIDWQVTGCDSPCLMWVDSDKLEKVLYNLCSNAMKHTPLGGRILVNLSESEENGIRFARFSVQDSGPGIPPDKRAFVFERFAQLPSGKQAGGTGIGLSYCKSLVELHHGTIEVGGTEGALFSFRLPMERQAYADREVLTDAIPEKVSKHPVDRLPKVGENVEGRPNVLVIDDDYEFVFYLQSLLSPVYNVAFRFDGQSGLQALEENPADLVISDVMMPGMDGFEVCQRIKESLNLCHIPVILLTAKAAMDSQIQGLDTGADAYIPKPFDKDYLLAMARSLLENRKRMQHLLESAPAPETAQSLDMNPLDQQFMDDLYAIMEQTLDSGEMNVDTVADQLHIGRSKFFYKVKALTGQTPNEYFTAYKLGRSLELLRSGKYKIAAVAAMVGFNSPSHFTTLFKKHFGYPPSQV